MPVQNKTWRQLARLLPLLLIVSLACSMPSIVRPQPTPTRPALAPTIAPTTPPQVAQQVRADLPPALVESEPLPGEEVALGEGITLYFNQPMDRASVEAAVSGLIGASQPLTATGFTTPTGQLAHTLTWVNDTTLIISPTQPLEPQAELVLHLDETAQSKAGLAMQAPVNLSFQTAGFLEMVHNLPANDGVEIDPSSAVVAGFNRPVVPLGADPALLPAAFSVTADDGSQATGRGEWVNTSTYVFYPEPGLHGGKTYTAALDPQLTSTEGGPLNGPITWSFSTAMPRLLSVRPGVDARLDAPVVLTFNQPMDPASVEANFSLAEPGGSPVAGTAQWNTDNTIFTYTPSNLLGRNRVYLITLDGQAQSLGGTPIGDTLDASLQTMPELAVKNTEPVQGGRLESYNSVRVQFTTPVEEASLLDHIRFTPEVSQLNSYWDAVSRTLILSGIYPPSTSLTLLISPTLTDIWGDSLGQPYTLTFYTAPMEAGLLVSPGTQMIFVTPDDPVLSAQATNVYNLALELSNVPLEDFFELAGSDGYALRQAYSGENRRPWQQALDTVENQSKAVEIPLVPFSAPGQAELAPGLYFLRMDTLTERSPEPYLIVVSPLHVTYKISAVDALVWVSDLASQAPVAGLPVTIYNEGGAALASGLTDAQGIFRTEIPELEDPYAVTYAVVGQPGEANFSLAPSTWSQGIEAWEFGLSSWLRSPDEEAYLYTDRPIYRPGQTVYFRGILRRAYNGRYDPPARERAQVRVQNEMGEELTSLDLPLSPFGTFHGEWAIPAGARPGSYSIYLPDQGNSIYFTIAEYRKPEINLQIALPGGDEPSGVRAGESFTATVNARYFFDAPAGNVDLHWALYANPDAFSLGRYQVGPQSLRFYDPEPGYFPGSIGRLVSEGDGETAPDGTLTLEFPTEPDPKAPGRTQRYTLEVTATDESGLPVSARAEMPVHPAAFYAGVRPDSWLGRAGESSGFEVLAANWNGQPAGAQTLHAEFSRVTWRQTALPNQGGIRGEPELTQLASTDFNTSDQGLARLAFTPDEPGTYQLAVTSTQPGDGPVRTELYLWVAGVGQVNWPELPFQRLNLTSDREQYQPGDTAQVFAPNPLGVPVQALLTVERGRILRHEVLTLEAGGSNLEVTLTGEDAPNVYVSLTLLGNGNGGRPAFRYGLLNLDVDPVEQTLQVELTAAPERLGPGENVTFNLRVTDSGGNPVQGEFSLALVDLAVLALADPNSQEIVPAYYSRQPLSVRTSLSLVAYSQQQLFLFPYGRGGGGGGESSLVTVRERFPDTAYWNAEIVTGPDGTAQVSVPLPDSLTTWVVDVRGVTADTRVGQTEMQVVTTKDLLVRPVTPRFFVAGDHALLAAVVQNNTDSRHAVNVSLQATGFSLDVSESASQQVILEPHSRARVEWWGTVQAVESVDLQFNATGEGGALNDAIRVAGGAIPVRRYLAPQAFATSGILDQPGQRLELVSLPRNADPAFGSLEVEIAPSLAAAVVEALDGLEAQPYDGTEQTLSRFLPNLATYRSLQNLGVQGAALQTRLDTSLVKAVQNLLTLQNYDGGWSWWQANGTSHPLVSAYALFALTEARQAGLTVDENAIRRAAEYLQSQLDERLLGIDPVVGQQAGVGWADWELDRRAFLNFAMARAGSSNPQELETLYNVRRQLSPWARALLALTLEQAAPGSDAVTTLVSDLQAEAVRSASGVTWDMPRDRGLMRNMVSPLSNNAIVIYALAQLDPASPLLADGVRFLMVSRESSQAGGAARGWGSTYVTAWTVLAINQVMTGTGELGGSFDFSATINDRPLVAGEAGGETQLTPVQAAVQLQDLLLPGPNSLVIERSEGPGRLYYSAALNVAQPVELVQPVARGLTIERRFELTPDLSTGANDSAAESIAAISSAKAGQRVTVHLALTLPHDMYYLAVEDYLPAGAEIVNTLLKTSELGAGGAPEGALTDMFDPRHPYARGWGWWWFNDARIYDDHIAWSAEYLPAGSYELTYTIVLLQSGEFRVLPAHAWQLYFPDVQATSAGEIFTIEQ